MLTIKCSKGSFLSLVNALSEPSFERLIKLSFDMWFKEWFFNQINVDNTTVDFDSTVITRHGDQQGSSKGYNPKRGRNSHHPLMAFVGQTRMVANAWLRPGNTAASSSCKSFMEETFKEALKGKKVGLVRADSGFYTEERMGYLEEEKLNYIMAARMYPNVKSAVWGGRDWVELAKGVELSEMRFSHENGEVRRYIIVKKHVDIRPDAGGKELFEDLPGLLCHQSGFTLRSNLERL